MIVTRSGIAILCQRPSLNAARAAETARSTSASVPSGTRPTTSRVAGLRTSSQRPPDEGTEAPSMNIRKSVRTSTAMTGASCA